MLAARQRERVGLDREVLVEQPVRRPAARLGEELADERGPVGGEPFDLRFLHQLEPLGPRAHGEHLGVRRIARERGAQGLLGGGALDDRDALAVEVGEAAEPGAGLGEDAPAVDEGDQAEIDVALARERPCRRAALEVHPPCAHRLQAVLNRQRDPAVLQLREAELRADAARDLAAQVDRVALRLALRIDEGEGGGVLDVSQRDRAVAADLLERSGLRKRRRGECARQGDDEQCPGEHSARILCVRGAVRRRGRVAAASCPSSPEPMFGVAMAVPAWRKYSGSHFDSRDGAPIYH